MTWIERSDAVVNLSALLRGVFRVRICIRFRCVWAFCHFWGISGFYCFPGIFGGSFLLEFRDALLQFLIVPDFVDRHLGSRLLRFFFRISDAHADLLAQ